jgi:hypothetical protein
VYVSDVSLGKMKFRLGRHKEVGAVDVSLDIIVACNYLSDTCIMWTRAVETRLASCVFHLFGSCQMTGPFVSVGSWRMSWSKYS